MSTKIVKSNCKSVPDDIRSSMGNYTKDKTKVEEIKSIYLKNLYVSEDDLIKLRDNSTEKNKYAAFLNEDANKFFTNDGSKLDSGGRREFILAIFATDSDLLNAYIGSKKFDNNPSNEKDPPETKNDANKPANKLGNADEVDENQEEENPQATNINNLDASLTKGNNKKSRPFGSMNMNDYKAEIENLRRLIGYPDNEIWEVERFNRFRLRYGMDPSISNISYVFFTRPLLNLDPYSKVDPYLYTLSKSVYGRHILYDLNPLTKLYNADSKNYTPFIMALTNNIVGFTPKDVVLRSNEALENQHNEKIIYASNYYDTLSADSFSVDILETSNLYYTNLIKTWVDYINNVQSGKWEPLLDYVQQRVIDYMSSMYYFLLGEDGHTITYYAKYTGVYPNTIPYSSLASGDPNERQIRKLPVTFQYVRKEDMNPLILNDFNVLVSKYSDFNMNTQDEEEAIMKHGLIMDREKEHLTQNNWCTSVRVVDGSLRFFNVDKALSPAQYLERAMYFNDLTAMDQDTEKASKELNDYLDRLKGTGDGKDETIEFTTDQESYEEEVSSNNNNETNQS